MTGKRNFIILALLSASIRFSGCSPKILSPDTGVYHLGTLYANSSRSVTAVYEAGLNAISKFEFKLVKKSKDLFYAELFSISADKKNITIKIQKKSDTRTDYQIVHESLNKKISVAIFKEMQKSLNVKRSN